MLLIHNKNSTPPENSTTPTNPPPADGYFLEDVSAVQITDTETVLNLRVGVPYEAKIPHQDGDTHSISSAIPVGLSIGLKTGTFRWTPTPDQVGDHVVTADGRTLTFRVAANPSFTEDLTQYGWVSGTANKKGKGTYGNVIDYAPDFKAFQTDSANQDYLSTKSVIYLRGGIYARDSNGAVAIQGQRLSSDFLSFRNVQLKGTPSQPVTIKPWGNERVQIRGSGGAILRFESDCEHLVFEGIEIKGESDFITYDEAIAGWWTSPSHLNGNGLAIAGKHITIKDCVIHEVLGQAAAFKESTNVQIRDCIIANSARWTIAGTTGIGFVNMIASDDPVTEQSNQMVGNLIYGVESRIFSHVFAKGFSHLTLDEGEGILTQPSNNSGAASTSYQGRTLIEECCLMYCGKGIVINTMPNCDIKNCSIYNVGTTITGKSKGLRGNKASNCKWEKNLIHTFAGASNDRGVVASFANDDSDPGFVAPTFTNNYGTEDGSGDATLGIIYKAETFKDVNGNDPTPHGSIPTTPEANRVGADAGHHLDLMKKGRSFSVDMEPDPYWQGLDYADQTKRIIDSIPSYLTADFSNWHDSLPYTDGNGDSHSEFDVVLTGDFSQLESGLNITSLKLTIVHTYRRTP